MNIRLRLFAAARQLAGQEFASLELDDGQATVGALREELARQFPALDRLLPHVRFAVNAQYATDDTRITPQDEVACIPPVSGG